MILYVNAAFRKDSRTKALGEYLLHKFDDEEVIKIDLNDINQEPLNRKNLEKRYELLDKNDFNNKEFEIANIFKKADKLIIVSPTYDYSFPSMVKIFVESLCVGGLTFVYTEEGKAISLCKGKEFYYVTTSGGEIGDNIYAFGYLKEVFSDFFGYKRFAQFKAENLDIVGKDTNEIIQNTKAEIDKYFNKKDE